MFENEQDKTNAWNQEHVFEHTMISLQCHNDKSSCLNDFNDLLHVAVNVHFTHCRSLDPLCVVYIYHCYSNVYQGPTQCCFSLNVCSKGLNRPGYSDFIVLKLEHSMGRRHVKLS